MLHISFSQAMSLKKADFKQLEQWDKDHLELFSDAFNASCSLTLKREDHVLMHSSGVGGKAKDWKPVCQAFGELNSTSSLELRAFLQAHFVPYHIQEPVSEGNKFTGYFEAALNGSRQKSSEYPYPVYRLPPNLSVSNPHPTREEIQKGVLADQELELLYVEDDVALFFAHVQGSATVTLDDGTLTRIGFAGKTNHPYRAIGAYLREEGHLEPENVNAESIKAWLYMNPEEREAVFAYNPSYIFFEEKSRVGGPVGAQGIALTPERSIAVDKDKIPYGIPVWVETKLTLNQTPYNRLMVTQDTGSAIKGSVRGDLFFGAGHDAEKRASFQNSQGRWFLLLPKDL
jgi:membrane-bound lytic murein transglycosylase A